MGILDWFWNNWFTLLQSTGIIAGLFFTGFSLRIDTKVRRVGNLFEVTKQHREIWTHLYSRPDLKRVLKPSINLKKNPVTQEEELFVNLLILHLGSAYHANKQGMFVLPEELREDVSTFFSLPIPQAVWNSAKRFQDADFIEFVEKFRTQAAASIFS